MKVLQVNKLYAPWLGGVETIVQQVAEGLDGAGDIQMRVLCCHAKGKAQNDEINRIPVHRAASWGMFSGMPLSPHFLWSFWLQSREADVINIHLPFPLADLALLLTRPGAKVVVHYHSDIVRQKIAKPIFGPFLKRTLKRADKILVSSPNLRDSSPWLAPHQDKCEVIPFGLEIEEYQGEDEKVRQLRDRYGKFVLFVGRLAYYKGVMVLLKAIKQTNQRLVMIGSGSEKEKCEEFIRQNGLQDRVWLLDHVERDELVNFMRAASAFVLPSIYRSEAFGIVLMEAMACGQPLISTELGTGTSFINTHEQTGLVVPPNDPQALAEAISTLMNDRERAQKYIQRGQELIHTEFFLQKMLDRIQKVYKSMV